MTIITTEELRDLATVRNTASASIYMPTHRTGREVMQDRIRLKNLLMESETYLQASDLTALQVDGILNPIRALLDDTVFWQHQSDGLAIFLTTDFARLYRVPYPFEPVAVVAPRFHLKPLLPLLSGNGRFYILTLSQEEIRLLQGTHYSLSQVEIEGVPQGLPEALRKDLGRDVSFHTGTSASRGRLRPAVFHGHGAAEMSKKQEILRYFRLVDAGLQELLHDEQAPLILVGLEYVLPIYREANTYPHLLGEDIKEDPASLDDATLHHRAWGLVGPLFRTTEEEARTRYLALSGEHSERAEDDLTDIVAAAYFGRIDTLFVPLGVHQWGTFDEATGEITLEDSATLANTDLLDAAAAQTLLNKGVVYAVAPEDIPGTGGLAAILRF